MTNILVLGGHGFIGSHIVQELEMGGHYVRVLSRSAAKFDYGGDWLQGDYLDSEKLSNALIGIDVVVHCISTTTPLTSRSDPEYDVNTNIIGALRLLSLMKKKSIPRIVFLSSGGTVYGNPVTNPVTEDHQLRPISGYGVVKVAIENFITIASSAGEVKSVILRPSNPVGERQSHSGVQGLVGAALHRAMQSKPITVYGDGEAIRDYIYVKDVANLVVKVVESDVSGTYNIGSSIGHSIAQILEMVERVTELKIERVFEPRRSFDVDKVVLSNSKARRAFGWSPNTSLENGILSQYNWMKQGKDI